MTARVVRTGSRACSLSHSRTRRCWPSTRPQSAVTLPDEALLAVDAASICAAQAGQARHSLRLDTLPRLPDTALPRGDLLPNEVLLHLLAPPATMATSSKGSLLRRRPVVAHRHGGARFARGLRRPRSHAAPGPFSKMALEACARGGRWRSGNAPLCSHKARRGWQRAARGCTQHCPWSLRDYRGARRPGGLTAWGS
jgi:hypothetical protein